MKTGHKILSAAAVIPLLSSCASYQQGADGSAWNVRPVFSVKHSAEKADGYYQLGRYYQGQNRYDQAVEAYQKALALDEGHAEARNGMGVIYAMQGKLPEAIQQFRLAVEQHGAAHIHNNLGYALYMGGYYAEAAQVLEHAVTLDPANQAAHTNLAQAQARIGVPAQAVAQAPQTQSIEQAPAEVRNAQPRVEPVAQPVSVAAAAVIAQPERPRQQEQAVEKVAERTAVAMVESSTQAVQVAPNVYELRERVEPQRVLVMAEPAQAPKNEQGMIMPVMQAGHMPTRVAEGRIHVGPAPQAARVQSNQAASRERASTPYSGTIKLFRIEVSNGNGLTGMGRKVANFLGDFGYARPRLTNQKTFQVPASEVHYRTGYREEAHSMMANLPGVPTLIEMNDLRQDVSIRVVLGKDWLRNVAYFDRAREGKIHLARAGSATGGQ